MQLQELADAIAKDYGRSVDFAFIQRIKASARDLRVILLKQLLKEEGIINPNSYTTSVEELITVDEYDSCFISKGCTIKRTKNKIPNILNLGSTLFDFIGTLENKSFSKINIGDVNLIQYAMFPISTNISYDFINNYIYVFNDKIQFIKYKAILTDPSKANKCVDGQIVSCSKDGDFLIESEIAPKIIGIIKNEINNTVNEDNTVRFEKRQVDRN